MTLFQFGCLCVLAVLIAPYVAAYIVTERERAIRKAVWDSIPEEG